MRASRPISIWLKPLPGDFLPAITFLVRLAAFALLAIAIPSHASAQWLSYPTPGIPRNADGSPNLKAPVPKTPDGKPDLSGIWMTEQNRPCDPEGCRDLPVSEQFFNIAYGLKEPLPFQPWAAAVVKQRMIENAKDDPDTKCLPQGILKMHTAPLMRKMVQLPGLLIILNERNATYRQVFLDGRPMEDDPNPAWRGYSVGKWEGDTLVIQSNGFRDDIWLDRNGSPMMNGAKTVERFRRSDFGHIDLEITVDDPKTYTKPWTVKLNQILMPDTELIDFFCLENEKDVPHMVGK